MRRPEPYIAVAAEVLQKLDLAQSTLGQDLLAEHIRNLLNCDALVCLVVHGGAVGLECQQCEVNFWDERGAASVIFPRTYQTMPYAPWPSSLVTV